MKWKWIFIAPAALLGIVLVTFIGGEVVRLLWNWLLPPLFGWRELTFWQALGMLALCRILFGGFGLRGGHQPHVRRRIADRIVDRVGERWQRLTTARRPRFPEPVS